MRNLPNVLATKKSRLLGGKQYLAATLIGIVVAPSPFLAQSAQPIVNSGSNSPRAARQAENKNDVLTQAEDYSMDHAVIAIAIAKGRKDAMTGEKIGDTLSDVIKKAHGIQVKYFVAPGGDYTAIAFFVKGHAYGPYGLKESLSGLSIAADDYNDKARKGAFSSPDAAKP